MEEKKEESKMKIKYWKICAFSLIFIFASIFSACSDNDSVIENSPEYQMLIAHSWKKTSMIPNPVVLLADGEGGFTEVKDLFDLEEGCTRGYYSFSETGDYLLTRTEDGCSDIHGQFTIKDKEITVALDNGKTQIYQIEEITEETLTLSHEMIFFGQPTTITIEATKR